LANVRAALETMEPFKPGLLRVAAACVVALLLEGPSASPGAWLPYLAVGLAAAYGVLLASGRSGTILVTVSWVC
jgi:hypothetical protein